MSLSNIFNPQSIAVIGASAQAGSVGNSILKNLLNGYKRQVFPINPKNTEILNTKCFGSVVGLPIVPDLAIVVVPAKFVVQVLQQVADKGVKGVVIISAGFKEIGGQGVELENQVKAICVNNQISLIGPNCLGVINPWIKMNGSFAGDMPPQGNIAFLSQSGAICTAVIDYANTLGLGFSKFVSVGNKALCSEVEMLKYLEHDVETEVIAIYAESLTDANLIIETMKTITKPVVILKSGRTAAGSGASSSHTGALASEDVLYDTLFRQAGIIRANTIEELLEYMQVLSKYGNSEKLFEIRRGRLELPIEQSGIQKIICRHSERPSEESVNVEVEESNIGVLESTANRSFAPLKMTTNLNHKLQVAIITNAGGPGVLTTDFVIQNGMELAKISDSSLEQLKLVLPATANFHNPFDLIGDAPAQRYRDALEVISKDQNVDAIIVVLTPQTTTEIDETANLIVDYAKQTCKPIIASFIGGNKVLSGVQILRQNGVVHIDFPENAAKALSVLNSEKLKVKSEKLRDEPATDRHSERPSKESVNLRGEKTSVHIHNNSANRTLATLKMTNFVNSKTQAQAIFDTYKAKSQNYIPEVDAKKIFELYNIPTVKSVFCRSASKVKDLVVKTFGQFPSHGGGYGGGNSSGNVGVSFTDQAETRLILKIISPDIMHKTDVGGIVTNVPLEKAELEFSKMMDLVHRNAPKAKIEGVLFAEMVDLKAGVEFILGAKKDASLGTVIMFGLGGTMVELISDVVFGFGKLERLGILEMLDQLKSKKIIAGYRGKDPLDLEAIIQTIQGLSKMVQDFPNILEVDINPLLACYNQNGVVALDAKIVFD
jgi:acetate---CoA ligase (ADP-forming)